MSETDNITDTNTDTDGQMTGQQLQADSLTMNTKPKLTVLSKGDNVIILIPSVDRGPADDRNIKRCCDECK